MDNQAPKRVTSPGSSPANRANQGSRGNRVVSKAAGNRVEPTKIEAAPMGRWEAMDRLMAMTRALIVAHCAI